MAEIGQLCKIELDQDTVYKIIDVTPINNNYIKNEVQKIEIGTLVDIEEVGNSHNKKFKIPVYNIRIIKN